MRGFVLMMHLGVDLEEMRDEATGMWGEGSRGGWQGGVGASNSLKSGDELCFTGAEWHGSI